MRKKIKATVYIYADDEQYYWATLAKMEESIVWTKHTQY